MGLAWQGKSIRNGDPIAVHGVQPAGLAVQGEVVYRAATVPEGDHFITQWPTGPVSLRTENFFLGFAFIPLVSMRVTWLGAWSVGNTVSRAVGLGTASAVLAQTTVDLGAVPANSFAYSAITPVTLTAGTQYGLQVSTLNDNEPWIDVQLMGYYDSNTFDDVHPLYGQSSFLDFWVISSPASMYVGLDFTFSVL